MKKLHISISTTKLDESIEDYTKRLGCDPCLIVPKQYAIWRTPQLNFSLRVDLTSPGGSLRHLGWEDPDSESFETEVDVNGIMWERFSAEQQAEEVNKFWPGTDFSPCTKT